MRRKAGPLGGYPLVDLEVDLLDGSYHDKDSNDVSFQTAGRMALQDAVARAKPVLLEPIMAVEASTPPDHQGDVIGDLNRRRGSYPGSGQPGRGRGGDGGSSFGGDVWLCQCHPVSFERTGQLLHESRSI